MDFIFETLRHLRRNCLKALEGLPDRALLSVPAGFRNNILWNAAHMVTSQELLCYGRAGQPLHVPEGFLAAFRKGTDPGAWTALPDLAAVKSALATTVDALEADYRAGKLGAYQEYETSFGPVLRRIEDALEFDALHEGVHLGIILAQRKLVRD